jgi:hypothetical protein
MGLWFRSALALLAPRRVEEYCDEPEQELTDVKKEIDELGPRPRIRRAGLLHGQAFPLPLRLEV